MELTKYKWKYIFNKDNRDTPFQINPYPERVPPTTLYKYYSMGQKIIDSFIECKVYCSHPYDFNDLFDCYKGLIKFDDENLIEQILIPVKKSLEEGGIQFSPEVVGEINWEFLFKKIGILSLTTKPDNILMWSHYNKHSGFVVEFDYQKFPFRKYGPFPINYQESIEPLSVKEHGLGLCVLYQTNIKSDIWKYEDEWRFIIDSGGKDMKIPELKPEVFKKLGGVERTFEFPVETIKSVTLGYRFFKEIDEIVRKSNEWMINNNPSSPDGQKKLKLLSFISQHPFPVRFCLPGEDFHSIQFIEGHIEKVDSSKFIFR